MKRFVRCTSMLLAIIMVFTIPTFAAENIEPKGSMFFMCSSVYFCNVSGCSFEAWFDVTATGMMDEIGVSFINIQRSDDGVNWITVRSCRKEFSGCSYLVDYNTMFHTAGISYTGTPGHYYRIYVELYARKGVNEGFMPEYSAPIYIPA